jgi:hypothetical protein
MVETFYATDIREEQLNPETEYYTLVLAAAQGDSCVVTQDHGWWDHELNHSKCDRLVLGTVDVESEARRIYSEQRASLIARGFVYVRSGLWTVPAPASARGAASVAPERWDELKSAIEAEVEVWKFKGPVYTNLIVSPEGDNEITVANIGGEEVCVRYHPDSVAVSIRARATTQLLGIRDRDQEELEHLAKRLVREILP